MGTLPIDRLKLAWHRLVHGVPYGEEAPCQYEPCAATVPEFSGYRDGHLVFCSAEHAALDQEAQIM